MSLRKRIIPSFHQKHTFCFFDPLTSSLVYTLFTSFYTLLPSICFSTPKEDIMALHLQTFLSISITLAIISSGLHSCESARVFTIVNNCKETIWPAAMPGDSFDGGGFSLKPHESRVFTAPESWSGRIWARTGCKFDSSGNGSCVTGACGSSLKCSASGKPPASLAEFTLVAQDFYDMSLVDGFNVPVAVMPMNGKGNCTTVGCDFDMRPKCPKELAVKSNGKVVGCRSACDVFNTDEYCCRGNYGNPTTCKPTYYSKKFKEACPNSYSYAYDDPSSIFTCTGPDYVVAFCSSRKQQVCSYHDHKLHCSGSKGLDSLIGRWMIGALVVFSVLSSWSVL